MADQKVLETFKRFDSDGSGSISREELGEVLKSLEGSVWDDASIDGLLAAADESGDGELQVEEFVKWVFAEDQAISGGVTGKFILKVSGCSRPELNGVYVKQPECYYRRPIFHCIENEKYLFYHGSRQQWQIYSRTGKYASARLKTHRAAHMPGDNVKWAVWKTSTASKKKSFVQESRMTCSAEPHMSAEEEFAKAADAIKFDEIFFKKTEESLGKRPVYKQWKGDDWAERFLFYEGPKSMWKVGNSAAFGRPSLYTSRTTDVYSPDLALWMDEARGGKIAVLAVDTDGVPNGMHGGLKINRAIKDGWKDPAFPHNNDSIGEKAAKNCKYSRWLRARALHSHPALFADVEPADACQGTVGNCWLIAAMSALAEFPSYIKNNLFVIKKVSKDGKYKIKLFDGRSNRWEIIEIDDYLPCTPWGGDKPDLLFGHMPDGKMCLALLEKAFAKMYGSWSDLAGGFQAVAWFHMTSCTEYVCYSASYRGSTPKWVASSDISVVAGHTKNQAVKRLGKLGEGANFQEIQRIGPWIEFKKLDGDGPESGWLKYYANGKRLAKRTAANELRVIVVEAAVVPEHAMGAISGDKTSIGKAFDYSFKKYVDAEEMWQILLKCDEGNYLMASSASKSRIERDSGMVHGHAYSVLHAVEIEGLRLVCCRNPWGNDSEWNGPWSDRSPEWKANPSIAEALNVDFQTEGSFWMDFEDWLYVMGQLKVMNCKMPSRRGDFHNQIVEEDEDEQEDVQEDVQEDAADEDEDEGSGTIKGCSGLGIDWHRPRTMAEGILLYPDKDYTFQNVPPVLFGGAYIGSHCWPKAGTWTIEYQAPAKLYVWAAQGQFNAGVDDALSADGWTAEAAENLCGGAISLNLWSKQFDTGSSYSIEVVGDTMVGGVIGTTPCVQLTPATRSEAVGGCAGLGVDWHPGRTMSEGILLYPDKDYKFENVPQVLLGGTYIGSHCWPKAGTWTIEYQAPVKLYVWATQGKYSGGLEDVLPTDGWAVEAADGFCGGAIALTLWSRHFTTGSSYRIKVSSDTMVAGVVGKQLECSGKVTGCSGLGVAWNPPRGMAEGILIYTDKDYTFRNVPACLTSGTYIGSHCWPKAGTWTIEYEAPTMLYVWVQQGTYNAGVDEVLKADGWLQEDAKDFLNVALGLDGFGSGLPLTLWSRHFASGSSYSIETKDLMIGGVISECSDL